MANDLPKFALGDKFKVMVKKDGPSPKRGEQPAPPVMVEDVWEVREISLDTQSVRLRSKLSGNVATSIADVNKMVDEGKKLAA